MKTLHQIVKIQPELNEDQLASLWSHGADFSEFHRIVVYIDTYSGGVSFELKETDWCTMDHIYDWIDAGSPVIDLSRFDIQYWNSYEESS